MKTKFVLIIVSCLVIFINCTKEDEPRDYYFRQSTFVEDPSNPGLPKYTELGYNTFGAYYDREVFVSNNEDVPMKVIVTNDTTTFIFQGEKSSNKMTLRIGIPNSFSDTYDDLLILNDIIIDLTTCKISITINDSTTIPQIINGTLEIKKAQKLYIDDSSIEVVLAGLFEFQLLINDDPIAISNGRFDIGVGYSNFFAY